MSDGAVTVPVWIEEAKAALVSAENARWSASIYDPAYPKLFEAVIALQEAILLGGELR